MGRHQHDRHSQYEYMEKEDLFSTAMESRTNDSRSFAAFQVFHTTHIDDMGFCRFFPLSDDRAYQQGVNRHHFFEFLDFA
jgi:hypothetical protein